MDSASDFGSEGCGFKSHLGRYFLSQPVSLTHSIKSNQIPLKLVDPFKMNLFALIEGFETGGIHTKRTHPTAQVKANETAKIFHSTLCSFQAFFRDPTRVFCRCISSKDGFDLEWEVLSQVQNRLREMYQHSRQIRTAAAATLMIQQPRAILLY